MPKKIFLLLLIAFCFSILNLNVKADTGPKPSITVKIKNLNISDYLIDLLVYDEDGELYDKDVKYNVVGLTKSEIEKLYSMNIDGWVSISTRSSLILPDCAGNKKHIHRFSYFGTPTVYKILIINNESGKIMVSDVIHRTEFTSVVTIDVNNMEVTETVNTSRSLGTLLIVLLTTILIEILIAFVFGIKNYKTILITNLITNILAQLIFIITAKFNLILFLVVELIVILAEYLLYKKFFKGVSHVKIVIYTIAANLLTALITFVPWF